MSEKASATERPMDCKAEGRRYEASRHRGRIPTLFSINPASIWGTHERHQAKQKIDEQHVTNTDGAVRSLRLAAAEHTRASSQPLYRKSPAKGVDVVGESFRPVAETRRRPRAGNRFFEQKHAEAPSLRRLHRRTAVLDPVEADNRLLSARVQRPSNADTPRTIR